MLALWWALCGATLAATAGAATYDPLDELDAYPGFQRGLRRYRQHHLRHHHHAHRPHKMALAHHYYTQRYAMPVNWNPDSDGNEHVAVVAPGKPTPMLPGRHPAVEKALDGMSGDLQGLKEKQLAAKEARGELEGKVSEAVRHMNDAMSIKHAIAQKEAQIRTERSKLAGLEREAKHVEETHSSLVASLHRVLEPKLMFARSRLERKEMVLEKEHKAVKGWQEKKEQIHAHALELIEAKKVAHQSLLESEHKVAEAKKEEEVARGKYQRARQRTSQEVQSFRYAETRVKAEVTHEKAAEEATVAAKDSVKKLGTVLEVESRKVEESMSVSKNQIHRRMQEVAAARSKNEQEVVNLQHKYRDWQELQRLRAAEVVRKGEDTAVKSEAYADRQKQVLDAAQNKVVHDAEAKSDWAWESGFSNDAGFTDSTPSLSD